MIEFDNEDAERASKTQRKRDATALQKLGEQLVALNAEQLQRMQLPDKLEEAVELAQRIRQRGGRKRQLQYIGKLLRNMDAEPLRQRLEALQRTSRESVAQLHRIERWRDRLIEEGDAAIPDVLESFPTASTQHLRQLIRNVHNAQTEAQLKKGTRGLFRYLRELSETSA